LQKQGEFELIAAELAGSYQQVSQFSLRWRIADEKIFDFLEGIQEKRFPPESSRFSDSMILVRLLRQMRSSERIAAAETIKS